MNEYRTSTVLTDSSLLSNNQTMQLERKVQILQMENAEYRSKLQASSMLNLTFKEALITISKKGRVDSEILDKLNQLSVSLKQTSQETLGELRQFYEEQLNKRDFRYSQQIDQLHFKHAEEIKILKDRLDRQNRQRVTKLRQQMLMEVRDYLNKEKSRPDSSKEINNGSKNSHRRKSSSSFSGKSKILNSSNSLQTNQAITEYQICPKSSARGKVARQIQCNNCFKIFAPNDFVSHVNFCKSDSLDGQESKEKLLKDLLKRKKEIESKLQRLAPKNQTTSQTILETDLDQIVYVIKNNGKLSTTEIQDILNNSGARYSLPKMNKKQMIVKRVR